MSVEAVGWAFRQKVPPKPKVVLLALADQADEVTGRVCYGKTDMKHLAGKASCGERSLYRYISALVRNGYIIKQSGKDKGHPSEYWLCMDRPRAIEMSEWHWKTDEEPDAGDPQDVDDGSAILADPPAVENESSDAQNGRGGLPQDGRHRVSFTSNITARASAREAGRDFSKQAQDAEIENRLIKAAAEKANAKTFVYENSEAWKAWCLYRRARRQPGTLPTCTHIVAGKPKRGWWMPSLFPPNDPKTPIDLTDAEAKEFADTG